MHSFCLTYLCGNWQSSCTFQSSRDHYQGTRIKSYWLKLSSLFHMQLTYSVIARYQVIEYRQFLWTSEISIYSISVAANALGEGQQVTVLMVNMLLCWWSTYYCADFVTYELGHVLFVDCFEWTVHNVRNKQHKVYRHCVLSLKSALLYVT
jgi:hypothetical protein